MSSPALASIPGITPATLRSGAGARRPGTAPLDAVSTPGADPAGFSSLLRQNQLAGTRSEALAPPPAPPSPMPAPVQAPLATARANPAAPATAAPNRDPATSATAPAAAPDTEAPPARGEESDADRNDRAMGRGNEAGRGGAAVVSRARSGRPGTTATAPETPAEPAAPAPADSAAAAALDPAHLAGLHLAQAADTALLGAAGPAGDALVADRLASGSDEERAANALGEALERFAAEMAGPRADAGDGAAGSATLGGVDRSLLAEAAADAARFALAATAALGERTGSEATAEASAPGTGAIETGSPSLATATLFAFAAPTNSDPAAPLVNAGIAAQVATPEFAQELGLRMSTFLRDGVQQAELHLNPAELGPVTVQIALDGTQARIDFGADAVATRQAIEAGLPELAGALRDAGFTLAGGGVSQRQGGGSSGDGGGRQPGRGPGERTSSIDEVSSGELLRAARRIATRGGVDLFA